MEELKDILNLTSNNPVRNQGRFMQNYFGFFTEGICLFLVGIFGAVGNICCVFSFSRKQNRKNFHILMLSTAVFELIYVSTAMALFSVPQLAPRVSSMLMFKRSVTVLLPIAHIALTGSIYLTLAIALERYTIVCHPFFKLSHPLPIHFYITPIIVFTLLYNIPKFFELQISPPPPVSFPNQSSLSIFSMAPPSNDNTSKSMLLALFVKKIIKFHQSEAQKKLEIMPTELRLNPLYVKFYLTYSNLFINGLFPLIFLLILNCKLYFRILQLRRCRQFVSSNQTSREVIHTQISLVIVAVFILCHSVRWIPNTWELRNVEKSRLAWPVWVHHVSQVSHLLTVLSSSVNFYIYLAKHGKFSCSGSSSDDQILSYTESTMTTTRL